MTEEAYLQQLGELLTPDLAGNAVVELARSDPSTTAPEYLLSLPDCTPSHDQPRRRACQATAPCRSTRLQLLHELDPVGRHARARSGSRSATDRPRDRTSRRRSRGRSAAAAPDVAGTGSAAPFGSSPPVTPLRERDERRSEVATLVGQHVLEQLGLLRSSWCRRMIPASTKPSKRYFRMLVAIPRLRWKSL